MKLTLLLSFVLALLVGCASSGGQYDNIKRKPTTQVDIFRDGQKPTRAYKEIGLLTDDGGLVEQRGIEAKLIRKAKRMGANAIIFQPLTKSGGELKGFSVVDTYVYRALVIVYE